MLTDIRHKTVSPSLGYDFAKKGQDDAMCASNSYASDIIMCHVMIAPTYAHVL